MNLTQPTVSHHVAFLEDELGVTLFLHKNKKVFLTPEGEYLQEKLIFMQNHAIKTLSGLNSINYPTINLGATLSVSDYLMPAFLKDMFHQSEKFRLNLEVENTEILLNHLAQGKIDAAFIEGNFNNGVFSSIPFKGGQIIGICGADSPLAEQKVAFPEIFHEHLFTREKGSGTRDALETILTKEQISISSFSKQTTVGSLHLIKELVADNLGIAFIFDICVQDELARGELKQLNFATSFEMKPFHFVYLADNPTTKFILPLIKDVT